MNAYCGSSSDSSSNSSQDAQRTEKILTDITAQIQRSIDSATGNPTILEMQALFLGQNRNPRDQPAQATRYQPTVKPPFTKTFVILLKKFVSNSRIDPSKTDLCDINEASLREIAVELLEEDTSTDILDKRVEYVSFRCLHITFTTIFNVFNQSQLSTT